MCSLKYWQTSFKNHTKEKTGILKAERLRDALLEVGMWFVIIIGCYLIMLLMMGRKEEEDNDCGDKDYDKTNSPLVYYKVFVCSYTSLLSLMLNMYPSNVT